MSNVYGDLLCFLIVKKFSGNGNDIDATWLVTPSDLTKYFFLIF